MTTWSSITFPGVYPKDMKTLIQKDIHTPMFTAALFTIVKTQNQPVSIKRQTNKKTKLIETEGGGEEKWREVVKRYKLSIKRSLLSSFIPIWEGGW